MNYRCILSICGLCFLCASGFAQQADKYIHKGNEFYKQREYDKSLEQYKQALTTNPKNTTAVYNQGNAQFRQNKFDEALESFNSAIDNSGDKKMQQAGHYNKGVALMKQSKLEESIDAWKNALKLDPEDQQARENLQKALRELKKKQEQQKQQQKKDKKDKDKKKEQDQDQQQQPPPSKLSKQRVEQLLKALQQKEKEVQDRLQKEKVASPRNPEKDW
jgi:Ca-activated chloride channel homolog